MSHMLLFVFPLCLVKCDQILKHLSPFTDTRVRCSSANLLNSVSDTALRQAWIKFDMVGSSFIDRNALLESLDSFIGSIPHSDLHPYRKSLFRIRKSVVGAILTSMTEELKIFSDDKVSLLNKLVHFYSTFFHGQRSLRNVSNLPESSSFGILAWNFERTHVLTDFRVLFLRKKTVEVFQDTINAALLEFSNLLFNRFRLLPIQHIHYFEKLIQATSNAYENLDLIPHLQILLYQSAGYPALEDMKLLLNLYVKVNPVSSNQFMEISSLDDCHYMINPQYKTLLTLPPTESTITKTVNSSNILRKISSQIDVSLSNHFFLKHQQTFSPDDSSFVTRVAILLANQLSALIASPHTLIRSTLDFNQVVKICKILGIESFHSEVNRDVKMSEIVKIAEILNVCQDVDRLANILA
jgi:hypothetical protein